MRSVVARRFRTEATKKRIPEVPFDVLPIVNRYELCASAAKAPLCYLGVGGSNSASSY